MAKERLNAVEYMRGISMLGVIGIHIGSQYLMNPQANLWLIAALEILTRFAVPIFFFISAFGLFWQKNLSEETDYRDFYRRRIKAVLIPYLAWSAFYILHYTFLFRDFQLLNPKAIAKYLIFGYASYQLYFLVILLWFYILFPLWLPIVRRLTLPYLAGILAGQIAFNYWSSYLVNPAAIASPILRYLVSARLNYWPMHYIFIFLLGAWAAVNWPRFSAFLRQRFSLLTALFVISAGALLGHFFYLVKGLGYRPEWAINTAHQLSPFGVLYTLFATLFLFAAFLNLKLPPLLARFFAVSGRHSYFAYLFHPVLITYISLFLAKAGLIVTAAVAVSYYLLVAAGSLLAAVVCRRLGAKYPWLNRLTIGQEK